MIRVGLTIAGSILLFGLCTGKKHTSSYSQLLKDSLTTEVKDSTLFRLLLLESGFNDSIVVKVGDKILYRGYCVTDSSTTLSNVILDFYLDSPNAKYVISINKFEKNEIFTFEITNSDRYIHIYRLEEEGWTYYTSNELSGDAE